MEDERRIVWLASYPKSGNTWVRVFLANLMNGGVQPADINALEVLSSSDRSLFDTNSGLASSDLTGDEIARIRPDVFRIANRHRARSRRREPLLVKVHEAFALNAGGVPIFPPEVSLAAIYLVRSPLDVAVSLAHHLGKTTAEAVKTMSGDEAGKRTQPAGCLPRLREQWSSWSANVTSWLSRADLPLTLIRYEDMQRDPLATFSRVAAAVVPTSTGDEIARAIELSRFEVLAAQERSSGFRERPPESASFFRKGIAGAWRHELSPDDVEAIAAGHGEVMARFGYRADDES